MRIVTLFLLFLGVASHASVDQKMLLESEKNTINVFQNSVKSVVNVTNIVHAKRRVGLFFDFDPMDIPAGSGSGFVWDDKGHIVTNYHVVAQGDSFMISFHKDKKQYKAEIIAAEPKKDIAVLKLKEMPQKLHPISIGNSKNLIVGQKAMALGNPFGLDHTITSGIISALDRKIDGIGGVKIHGMIQTDSSINPGNSGGPLLDSSGNLIGMNTMIFSKSGSSAGIGFAVPVDTIKRIVPQLITYKKIKRPGLGIIPLEDHMKSYLGIDKGIVVKSLQKGGSADKAGLRGMKRGRRGRIYLGDIILKIDGKEMNNLNDIYHLLESYKVGDKVTVIYEREGKIEEVKLKLIEL